MDIRKIVAAGGAVAIAILGSVGSFFATSVMLLAPLAVRTDSHYFRFGAMWMLGTWLFIGSLWLLLLFEWRASQHHLVHKLIATSGFVGIAMTLVFGFLAETGLRMPLLFFSLPLLLWAILTFRLFRPHPE